MKINFQDKGSSVICKVDSDRHPIEDYYHPFTCEAVDGCCAKLLAHHLRKAFGDAVENMREQEYEAGYKAGRRHRQKRKWFSRLLED